MKFSPRRMLSKAVLLASECHYNQYDKGGKPYILHPLRLMNKVDQSDFELMSIAVLHDVVEDCEDISIEVLRNEGMSERILTALELLTHKEEDSYQEYIEKISRNIDAIEVKMADLEDNSDITRLKGLGEKDIKRLEKYHKSYTFLKNAKESIICE